jgi:hypothetical protein
MEYLIPIVLVLLLVSGFVTFLVLNATRQSKPSEAENSGDSDPRSMAATDASPLGDTTEHAGEQTAGGETAHAPEGEGGAQGGTASGVDGGGGSPRGGEAADAPSPDSERLADRHQV